MNDFAGWMSCITVLIDNFATQSLPYSRRMRQVEQNGAQQTSSGITARNQQIQNVVSQNFRVLGIIGKRLQKHISIRDFSFFARFQSDADVVISDIVHVFAGRCILFVAVDKKAEFLCADPSTDPFKGLVERATEFGCVTTTSCVFGASQRLAKEEVCGRVVCEGEEERLDVEKRAVFGNFGQKVGDVFVHELEVSHLSVLVDISN